MFWLGIFFVLAFSFVESSNIGTIHGFYGYGGYEGLICHPKQPVLNRIDWIFSQRRADYGWGENTHRAIVALALNDFGNLSKSSEEVQLMEYQLEVELAKALMRNDTHPILLGDLALYIHALLTTNRNPRDFYQIDLVQVLKKRLDTCTATHANVFAILSLCNSRAVEGKDVAALVKVLDPRATRTTERTRTQIEFQAIALKALACAVNQSEFQEHAPLVKTTSSSMANSQKSDGSFGNVYTTALIMQALFATDTRGWDEEKARQFLLDNSADNINMVSTYYIEMALNAHKVRFLRDLNNFSHPHIPGGFPSLPEIRQRPLSHYVQYSLRVGPHPDVYHTITIKVPSNATFFDIMRLSADENPIFNFSWTLNYSRKPAVYQISGVPNDVEESYYWRLVYQTAISHDRRDSVMREIPGSPEELTPVKDSHMIYWYLNAFENIPDMIQS